uniref:Uncharacterized protein n=1 Tax=viral metagenome TaxID=1070528 RepID=A0A6M3JA87_9ZZZZ
MKICLARVDNCLVDVTSIGGGPDAIPGNVEVEIWALMPLAVFKAPDLLMRTDAPYFRRVEAMPSLGKQTAEGIIPLYELPPDIREMWRNFEKAVIDWAEKEVLNGTER